MGPYLWGDPNGKVGATRKPTEAKHVLGKDQLSPPNKNVIKLRDTTKGTKVEPQTHTRS